MFISFVLFSCCCCCLRSQFVSDNTIINRLLSLSQTKPSAIATPTVENVPRDAAEAATRAAAARCPSTCHWQVTSSCRMHWRCTATRSVWFTCTSLARRTPRPARAGVPTVWRVSEPPSFPVLHYYYLSLSLCLQWSPLWIPLSGSKLIRIHWFTPWTLAIARLGKTPATRIDSASRPSPWRRYPPCSVGNRRSDSRAVSCSSPSCCSCSSRRPSRRATSTPQSLANRFPLERENSCLCLCLSLYVCESVCGCVCVPRERNKHAWVKLKCAPNLTQLNALETPLNWATLEQGMGQQQ